ncbi:hypothetical protein B0T18DRAFT_418208 [Schizothecium vesticola]|uniref:Uncharacterized protein n=1 Tax=Schizothecium vesticola TaxID=314040 RepID=A0AA40EJV4_9PEZI|nr:hypothetical protein B0T18DRAFT_418208 [Schizothecium vesticola]
MGMVTWPGQPLSPPISEVRGRQDAPACAPASVQATALPADSLLICVGRAGPRVRERRWTLDACHGVEWGASQLGSVLKGSLGAHAHPDQE